MNMIIDLVKTDNFEMEYCRFGTGKNVFVIIPGLSLKSVMISAKSVASAYSGFTDDYTVYLFDRKKNVNEGYTISQMADDTAEAMQTLGIYDAYVFGASQGGMIVQYIAIRHPELVKKAVLGSTISRINNTAFKTIKEWTELAQKRDNEALVRSFITNIYSRELVEKYGEMLMSFNSDVSEEEYVRFINLATACEDFNVYDELEKIKCPILVVGAVNDMTLSGDSSVEIADKLGCELYVYEKYGHGVYDEAPDYKKRILDFFNK